MPAPLPLPEPWFGREIRRELRIDDEEFEALRRVAELTALVEDVREEQAEARELTEEAARQVARLHVDGS